MHFTEALEKQPIAGHGKRHPSTGQNRAIERCENRHHGDYANGGGSGGSKDLAHEFGRYQVGIGDLVGGQHIEVSGIGQEVNGHHGQRAQDQRFRQILLWRLNFGRYHRDVVPTVVSPKDANQRGEESGESTGIGRDGGIHVAERALAETEADHDNGGKQAYFGNGDHQLHTAAKFDAKVIDAAEAHDQGDGHELSSGNFEGLPAGADGRVNAGDDTVEARREVQHGQIEGGG